MKTNTERAREQLTLTPEDEFSLEKDSVIGALYRPENDKYPEGPPKMDRAPSSRQ